MAACAASTAASAPGAIDTDALLRDRKRVIGYNCQLNYPWKPMTIVKGEGQFLYDSDGRQFLDGVNNVCHVGHCHPKVVAAACNQLATLNTNSRYLHPTMIQYAKDLLSTFPPGLREGCVYFVNSGSEANDLALRIARAHTGGKDVVCIDHAYHGHVSSTIGFSPYKFDHKGGDGKPDWVHRLPIPCSYRGHRRGRSDDPAVGAAYAADARAQLTALSKSGRKLSAFYAESMLSCGGQIVLPKGYLRGVYDAVRSLGGVCVADEVQVGFGRVGTHWWAFETQGVVPDMVTLGKPMGNGFPLSAVVVKPELARSFDNGMGYFNTYGGNPVACAVGQAVLDAIKEDRLISKAVTIGKALLDGFRVIGKAHEEVGDVRGLGLFVGAEIVKPVAFGACAQLVGLDEVAAAAGDVRTQTERVEGEAALAAVRASEAAGAPTLATSDAPPSPWKELAEAIAQRMRERGVLVAVDGPWGNVIKMKPPMCFTLADVERTIREMMSAIQEVKPACYAAVCGVSHVEAARGGAVMPSAAGLLSVAARPAKL